MDYNQVAKEVLQGVGGNENVENLVHCVTRLRFTLKDSSIAKTDEIKKVKGVISVIEQSGQYQVVIGNEVPNVFAAVQKLRSNTDGLKTASKEVNTSARDVKVDKKEKAKILSKLASIISSIFVPVIGLFAGSGFIKGLLVLLSMTGVLPKDSSTYIVLYSISDAVFYFFPIFLGYTAGKYFGANPFLTMAIGAGMVYPNIVAAAPDIMGAVKEGAGLNSFMGIPLNIITYSNTVFPIIVSAWIAAKLEGLLKRVVPKVLQLFTVPALVLIIIFPVTLLVVGPVTNFLSNGLAQITVSIYGLSPILCGLLLAGAWTFVVMGGLHWAFIPLYINNMMTFGHEPLEGLLYGQVFAIVGTALAIAIKAKDKEFKSLATSSSISALFGVSEPALYGLLIPLKKPLIVSCIASGVAGAVAGAMGAVYYGAGIAGVFAFTLGLNPQGADLGFYGLILSAAVGFILSLVITLFTYKGDMPEGQA